MGINIDSLQVVQPRYAEAIRLASKALEESSSMEEAQRPLPYMYGSPEYLQVCSLHLIKHVVGITTCCCVMVKVSVSDLHISNRWWSRAFECLRSNIPRRLLGMLKGGSLHQPCKAHPAGRRPQSHFVISVAVTGHRRSESVSPACLRRMFMGAWAL